MALGRKGWLGGREGGLRVRLRCATVALSYRVFPCSRARRASAAQLGVPTVADTTRHGGITLQGAHLQERAASGSPASAVLASVRASLSRFRAKARQSHNSHAGVRLTMACGDPVVACHRAQGASTQAATGRDQAPGCPQRHAKRREGPRSGRHLPPTRSAGTRRHAGRRGQPRGLRGFALPADLVEWGTPNLSGVRRL